MVAAASSSVKYDKLAPMSIESAEEAGASQRSAAAGGSMTRDGGWCEAARGFHQRYPRFVMGLFVVFVVVAFLETVVTRVWVRYRHNSSSSSSSSSSQAFSESCAFEGTYPAVQAVNLTERVSAVVGGVTKHGAVMNATWERRIDNGYPNVVKTKDLWRLWYGACYGPTERACKRQVVLYAESKDGKNWSKPDLGNHNILMQGGGVGVSYANDAYVAFGDFCLAVGRATKSKNKSKSGYLAECPEKYRRANVATSPDGITNWSSAFEVDFRDKTQRWDTHNNLFYDEPCDHWIATTRTTTSLFGRQIAIAKQRTLEKFKALWPGSLKTTLRNTTRVQPYAQLTFRWHSVLLGLVMIFDTTTGKVHCRLAYATDPQGQWEVVAGDFIPLGTSFDSDVCFAAKPVSWRGEHHVYYMGGNAPHSSSDRNTSLGLATLETDRFVGIKVVDGGADGDDFGAAAAAAAAAAALTTRTLASAGGNLTFTLDAPTPTDCLYLDDVWLKKNATEFIPLGITASSCGKSLTAEPLDDLSADLPVGAPVKLKLRLTGKAILYTIGLK